MAVIFTNLESTFSFFIEEQYMTITSEAGEIKLTSIQVAALDHYSKDEHETHLGNNLYIISLNSNQLKLQFYEFDLEQKCLKSHGTPVTVTKSDLNFAFSIFRPYIKNTTPCYMTHLSGNQQEAFECITCNPDFLFKELLSLTF